MRFVAPHYFESVPLTATTEQSSTRIESVSPRVRAVVEIRFQCHALSSIAEIISPRPVCYALHCDLAGTETLQTQNTGGCRSSKCYGISERISASNDGPQCFTTYGNRRFGCG